jgi:acyl-coenzyme A synthetase/AMP-(fatty) acid ligase
MAAQNGCSGAAPSAGPVFGYIRIVEEDGEPVSAGVTGEIYILWSDGARPPYHHTGAEPRSREGWESLGDLGWVDEDGYRYIAGRRTDRSAGFVALSDVHPYGGGRPHACTAAPAASRLRLP